MPERDEEEQVKVSDRRLFGGMSVDEVLKGVRPDAKPEPAPAPKAEPPPAPKAAPPPPPPPPQAAAPEARAEPEKKGLFGGLFGAKKEKAAPAHKDLPRAPGDEEVPPMDFTMFVLSLHHTVLIALGEAPDPFTGEMQRSLPAAKQNIDLLAILEKKTKGNLDAREAQILEAVLAELRMLYVEHVRRGA